jgi:hypothetical protein
MRDVFIDPSGFLQYPWMAVLVRAVTGVTYTHQTGGTACIPRQIEGYYVPVFNQDAYDTLRSIFEERLGGAGTRDQHWTGQLLGRVSDAVALIRMDPFDGGPGELALSLNKSRLTEIDEAWVPVDSPDGPAVLIWENSD